MKLEEIKDVFIHVENNFEVDNWEIDGVKFWPFIRVDNYMSLSFKALGSKPSATRSYNYSFKIIKSKFDYLFANFLNFSRKTKTKYKADIVFLSDGMSYINLGKKWYSKFFDPLEAEFNLRGYSSLRLDLGHNFYTPTYSPSKFIQSKIDNIIIKVLIWTKLVSPKFINENWGDYELFYNDIFVNNNFISIPSKGKIRNRVFKIINLKNFHVNNLRKINPKLAFVVNFYGDDQMAFILACKELDIPTIDIQHGVQGPLHLSYGNWRKIPKNGFPQMPDYFWVWSQSDKETIEKWSHIIQGCNAVVVGNLFNQLWKDSNSDIVLELDILFKNLKHDKSKKSILVTLSPFTDSLMTETWKVIKKTQYDYNWFIRLHPGMLKDIHSIKEKLSHLKITQYELAQSTRLPLPTILRNVDIHITCQSSCVIEAADFGVISIITSEYGQSLYKDQISFGNAFFFKYEDEIISGLNKINRNIKGFSKDISSISFKTEVIDELISKHLI